MFVFDSNGEPRYREKFIYLNGKSVARVPANTGTVSTWQEGTIDLAPEHISSIRPANTLEIQNSGGDYFKFAAPALAVRLIDGRWIETAPCATVHSSVAEWAYAEGTVFSDDRSAVIELRFE